MPSLQPVTISELPMLLHHIAQVAVGNLIHVFVCMLQHGQHIAQHLGGVGDWSVSPFQTGTPAYTPGFPPAPVRNHGTRCHHTCDPAPGRYPSWTPCDQSVNRLVLGRLPGLPGRRPPPQRHSGCGVDALEDQGDVLPSECLLLEAPVLGCLEVSRQLKQKLQLIGSEVKLF